VIGQNSAKCPRIFSLAGLLAVICISGQAEGDAVYTDAQAMAGKVIYDKSCADCHHLTLKGSAHGSELNGGNFIDKWGARSIADLVSKISISMPPTAPHSLGDAAAASVAAYIVRTNGGLAGDRDLKADSATTIGRAVLNEEGNASAAGRPGSPRPADAQTRSAGDEIAAILERQGGFANKQVGNFNPVTADMLRQPPPADWLSWRRTLDGQGYSPLQQIKRTNVKGLKLAWAITMAEGSNQATPLVHDGIMYLVSPGNVVQALDAATGDLIWNYAYSFPPESRTLGGPTRNIAIYKDKIFLSTYDAALVALDARTGQQVWRSVKANYKDGYTHTAGPIIADGVVISGINGCEQFKRGGCFVTGHDPDSGKELWRTSTIALPGDPNDASWAGHAPELRAGGDTWIPGSYDPELRLFYIGTAQAKPWVAASRHMSPLDAALYTDSTLALDPNSGKMVWYYQHVAGETLDMDTVFERVLVDLDAHRYLFTIGKDGILWKLDRSNGKFVDFAETSHQNIFLPLDKSTGRLKYRQQIIDAKVGDPIATCPASFGGHNWQATAYSPETRSLIIPLHQLCGEITGQSVKMTVGGGGYGGEQKISDMPDTNGELGRLSSWDLRTMKLRWSHTQRALFTTGALTTAGGLAFIGDADRYFKAFDVSTGKLLWKARLATGLHGYPITYSAHGRQYVAVPTGMGVFRLVTSQLMSDVYQPQGGNALYVFELP
jgi:alcohol dehydrogenase (cytochrome c)